MNAPSSTPQAEFEKPDVTTAVTASELEAAWAAPGRLRQHRFPARPHALKVLYGDDELAAIARAETAGPCSSASLSAG